jgi:hypothetical protein
MMLKYLVLNVLTVLLAPTWAVAQQTDGPPPAPTLEWLLTYSADFNLPLDNEDGPSGRRVIWPVRSGKFTGSKLSGTMHSLGGDWSLVRLPTTGTREDGGV